MQLRQFLHLDTRLTRDLLAQIEGGIYESQQESTRASTAGSVGGGIGVAGIKIGAKAGQVAEDQAATTWQQTSASEFERLYQHLLSQQLRSFPPVDRLAWTTIRRGDCLEIEAIIRPSPLATLRRLTAAAGEYLALAEATGQAVEEGTRSAIDLMKLFGEANATSSTLVATVAEASDFQFRLAVSNDDLRYPHGDLEGEAMIVGKVGRIIQPDQRLQVEDFLSAMAFLSPAARRKAERSFEKIKLGGTSIGAMSLPYPAADLTPLAIFR